MQARLRQNIIFFVVGLCLWAMIFAYLETHPGEKASLLPSITLLVQKVQSVIYPLIGKDPKMIELRGSLTKNFDELTYLIESNEDCSDPLILEKITQGRADLSKVSDDQLSSQQYAFYTTAVQIKSEIETKCGKK